VYVISEDGELVDRFSQFGSTRYGISDLAFDGELIWGVEEDTVYGFTPDGELVRTLEGPFDRLKAITWDCDRENLWTCGLVSDYIWCMDRDGNVLDSIDQHNLPVYGLAYFPQDDEGHTLYLFHYYLNDKPIIHKIDPESGDSLFEYEMNPVDGARCQGAFITPDFSGFSWMFVSVLSNRADDRLEVRFLGQKDWFDVDTSSGILDPGEAQDLSISISSNLLPRGDYNGRIDICHNAAGDTFAIDVGLTVSENSVSETNRLTNYDFRIASVYPNPFNKSVNIEYIIDREGDVSLSVLDLQGRVIQEVFRNRL